MTNQIKIELQEFMGSDRSIAEAAWTSSIDYQKKEARTEEDVARVVKLLADSKHSVPFESVVLRFWMKLPIAIDRQLMTHRIASHSGMSGRYRTMPSEWLAIPDDVANIVKNLQDGCLRYDEFYMKKYAQLCNEANEAYQQFCFKLKEAKVNNKISSDQLKRAREFFRGMLPQHNMTERVTVINLRSWCNFYRLRSKLDAQPEIQQIAALMLKEIKANQIAPIALAQLEQNNWSI